MKKLVKYSNNKLLPFVLFLLFAIITFLLGEYLLRKNATSNLGKAEIISSENPEENSDQGPQNIRITYTPAPKLLGPQVEIYDNCNPSMDFLTCKPVRTVMTPPSADIDVENLYKILTDIYFYFKNNFDWKSYDGNDSTIKAVAHWGEKCGLTSAMWLYPSNIIAFCDNTISPEIIAHEFTHGIILNATNSVLRYWQAGSINESIADIFAFGFTNSWLQGGICTHGPQRDISNPRREDLLLRINCQSQEPDIHGLCFNKNTYPFADRLFDDKYLCNPGPELVHANSTILSKAFYLMIDGGDFNGCRINGIGKDKSLKIIWQTIKSLSEFSNFLDIYNLMNKSCDNLITKGDLSDVECNEVKRAMQAVEIDQQPKEANDGPTCFEGNIRKLPKCTDSSINNRPYQPILLKLIVFSFPNNNFEANKIEQILNSGISYPRNSTKTTWESIENLTTIVKDNIIANHKIINIDQDYYQELYNDYLEKGEKSDKKIEFYAWARGKTTDGQEVCIKSTPLLKKISFGYTSSYIETVSFENNWPNDPFNNNIYQFGAWIPCEKMKIEIPKTTPTSSPTPIPPTFHPLCISLTPKP